MTNGGPASPASICDLLDRQIQIRPQATAVRTPTRSWSYSDLDAMTARLGHKLMCAGAVSGSLVGLLAPLGPAALVGLIATLRCGAACMPLDPSDPPHRRDQILAEARCELVLSAGSPGPASRPTLLIDDPGHAGEGEEPAAFAGPAARGLAYAISTSGSTGRPKIVAVPHDALLNLVITSIEDFSLRPERDVVLWLSRPTVDVTMQDCLMALCGGAALAIPDRHDFLPSGILTAARTLGATVVDIPAAVVGAYGEALLPRLARAGVRIVIAGGSRLDGAGLPGTPGSLVVYNAYGPTETTVTATLHRCGPAPSRWPPIGRPIGGVGAYVLDERLHPVRPGGQGQLYLGGAGVSWGYLGRPGRTAAVFLPDPFAGRPGQRMYATGDRVCSRPDGDLEFLDRIDNQVKVSGFRIEIGEVEHGLYQCRGVREAAVVVRDDVPGGTALVAFVAGDQAVASTINDELRDLLPPYMIPRFFVWLSSMPLNRQGKVDRARLLAIELPRGAMSRGGGGLSR